MRSLSRQEVRAVDRCAIEHFGVSGAVLMENAGRGVADVVSAHFLHAKTGEKVSVAGGAGARPAAVDGAGAKVAVVAGGGNNGGDGFVIARHLALRGVSVTTFLVAAGKNICGDARTNLDILRKFAHDVRPVSGKSLAGLGLALAEFDVIVDALGGTGISGELRADAAAAVEAINAAGASVVAVDIPTGLDCDTGQATQPTVRADVTVTCFARKKGFDADSAAAYTGRVVVADLGIDRDRVMDFLSGQG